MEFIPDDHDDLRVPYFEDASSLLGVIGHSTQRSEQELRVEIERAMGHLGASILLFQAGKFGDRYGYRIEFRWRGGRGRIDVAALPLKKDTPGKRKRCKRQALFTVMRKLEGQYNSQLNMPGDVPLVPYMLDASGRTLIEAMRERNELPALTDSESDPDVVEGDFRESD